MKKTIVFALALMFVLGIANAYVWEGSWQGGGATVQPTTPRMETWDVTYHLDGFPDASRNSLYPDYEYQYAGETVHFYAKISDGALPVVDNSIVKVILTCPSQTYVVTLSRTSDGTYNPATGRYEANFAKDYTIPASEFGNCPITVNVTNTFGSSIINTLSDSIYQNVNDILMNPTVTLTSSGVLSFNGMVPGGLTEGTPSPWVIQLSSQVDRESQGVVGNFSINYPMMCGTTIPTDCIQLSQYNYRLGSGDWKNLVPISSTVGKAAFGMLDIYNVPTALSTNWRVYFAANHQDSTFANVAPIGWQLNVV